HPPRARETSHSYRRDEHTGGGPPLQAPQENSPRKSPRPPPGSGEGEQDRFPPREGGGGPGRAHQLASVTRRSPTVRTRWMLACRLSRALRMCCIAASNFCTQASSTLVETSGEIRHDDSSLMTGSICSWTNSRNCRPWFSDSMVALCSEVSSRPCRSGS